VNGAARTSRARRGRLLIVGETPELDALLSRIPLASGQPVRAKNLFEALGEITTAPAGSPIATVVLSERHLPPMSDRALESMHKIDPSLRIVMITAEEEFAAEARDWSGMGVDECVTAPLAAEDLHKMLGEDLLARAAGPDDLEETIAPPAPPRKAEPPPASESITERPQLPHDAKNQEIAREVTSARAQPIPAPPPPHATYETAPAAVGAPSTQPLGDTDLVESLLSGADELAGMSLQLMAQQTGWRDIVLGLEQTPAAAPVVFNDLRFGFLACPDATSDQLQPWADWLARWLALTHWHHTYRVQAMQDDLTGAGNRRYFDKFLRDSIKRAARVRRPVTLMILDIDNFKSYNDQFGHDAGDDILRETVRLMQSVIRQGDRVCRIGGDEFAVIFADDEAPREPGSRHPESVEAIAKRFQDQICQMRFPKLGPEAPGTLTISAGLATYPWDGADPAALLQHADQLALESKRKGKNLITFGQGAMRACRPTE
jgi:diguanylate cyclase (GGDEF)-like protein